MKKIFLGITFVIVLCILIFLFYPKKIETVYDDNRPSAMMAIQSNIIGKWQSIDDQKFTREFQPDFEVVDTYDGIPDTGIWTVYTGAYAPNEATFPVELDAGYIQLTFAEEEGIMKLNFKVEKLTPEELELTYMERGNILRFSRVQ